MAKRIQHPFGKNAGIQRHDRSRHPRHTDRHECEQFAAAHPAQVGAHQQARLHHAKEDVGCGRQANAFTHAHRPAQRPCEGAYDQRKNPPVKKHSRKRADHQHDGKRLKCKDEGRPCSAEFERRRCAAQITKHCGGGTSRGTLQPEQQGVGGGNQLPGTLHFEKHHAKSPLERNAACEAPPGHRPAVLR
jgi:hypothetical protein